MPTALPVIRGTSAALYPFTQTISFDTGLIQFQNGSEQRWVRRAGLMKFSLPYGKMTRNQKNTLLTAIHSAKGAFDTSLSLTLGSTTYTNLSLDSDEWVASETDSNLYDGPVTLTQTVGQILSPGTASTSFPALTNGTIGQRPYTEKTRYQSVAIQMQGGPKYTYAEFSGGLGSYPATGLKSWEFDERHLTDDDLLIRQNHFIANYGRAFAFGFTTEEGTVYSGIRYASDDMVITYNGYNDSSVKTSLVQPF